jgi:hypothetical protein
VHRESQSLGQVADVGGLVLITRAEHDDVCGGDHRHRAHRRQQVGPADAEQPGDRHVCGLAGGGGDVVIDVDVPVGVRKSHPAEHIARRSGSAHQDRATAAEQQRALAGRQQVRNGSPDRRDGRAHGRPPDDAAERVTVRTEDPHRQVAGIGRLEPANEPEVAHRLGRELGAEQWPAGRSRDAVDRYAERRP